MLQAGLEDELITSHDRLIAKAMLVGVPLLVLAVNAMTISEYPNAIPLQASLDQILPLSAQVNAGVVDVETLKAEYRIPERSMEFTVKVNNRSENPVQIGEFSTANVHFLNKDLQAAYQGDSTTMTAIEGLSLENAAPIQPGEQRTMTITARDGFWESEKLNGLIRDADSRIGGLLFLYDSETAARYISSITAAVIPKFN